MCQKHRKSRSLASWEWLILPYFFRVFRDITIKTHGQKGKKTTRPILAQAGPISPASCAERWMKHQMPGPGTRRHIHVASQSPRWRQAGSRRCCFGWWDSTWSDPDRLIYPKKHPKKQKHPEIYSESASTASAPHDSSIKWQAFLTQLISHHSIQAQIRHLSQHRTGLGHVRWQRVSFENWFCLKIADFLNIYHQFIATLKGEHDENSFDCGIFEDIWRQWNLICSETDVDTGHLFFALGASRCLLAASKCAIWGCGPSCLGDSQLLVLQHSTKSIGSHPQCIYSILYQ